MRQFFGRIPKGFRNKAQGCEERATLGTCLGSVTTLKGLRPPATAAQRGHNPVWGCETSATFTQGSSSLATLGFVAESLWDSPKTDSIYLLKSALALLCCAHAA